MGIVSNGYKNSWAANKQIVIHNLCHTLWQHEPSSVWWGVEPLTSPESETSISDSTTDMAMFGWREKKKNTAGEKRKESKRLYGTWAMYLKCLWKELLLFAHEFK